MIPLLSRPGDRSRRGRLVTLVATPVLGLSLIAAVPSPATTTDGTDDAATGPMLDEDFASSPDNAEPVAVTLITGDTVFWQDSGDGNASVAEIEEASRDYPVSFDQSGTQEDFYVVPTDVREDVVSGALDRELFNIPSLVRQGLDDESTGGHLPVIVTFDAGAGVKQLENDANALPAASQAQGIEGIQGAGIKINTGEAGRFREAVLGASDRQGGGSTTQSRSGSLAGAVDKILLDQVLEIDLSESVPQIGAPLAWEAGYTGEGVTVAVIDTGVDDTHPDLAGQVVAAQNFAGTGAPVDDHGHGTHVASTIAGTGAASGGARRGVAPDADLLSGKVCNAQGECFTSWIMAGMEWAAEQGADIVNMSLGNNTPSDGTDAMSQLVNQLSAETGTLFVTSAGNAGGFQSISWPAAADAALAVGAVDKSDQLASFSSRGPRIGDHAVKPEITAPGVGIVAARGTGTELGEPIDDHYTSLNGTSMASPHVAGAAALLAQAKPGLSGQELKDALVSTAADTGFLWFEQGAGRVDVPSALGSPVYATGTINVPNIDTRPEQELTYTNDTAADITLNLDLAVTDRDGHPVDGVTLSANTLIVPAKSNASVTVSVDTSSSFDSGPFGGIVRATGDGVHLRTAVGFGRPLPIVTVQVLDSRGALVGNDSATEAQVALVRDTGDGGVVHCGRFGFTSGGVATCRVTPGVYTVMTNVKEYESDMGVPMRSSPMRSSLLSEVEVLIESSTTLTLDARDAIQVEVTTPRETVARNHGNVSLRRMLPSTPDGTPRSIFGIHAANGLMNRDGIYVTPAPTWELEPMMLDVVWVLAEPRPLHTRPDALFDCAVNPWNINHCYSEAPEYIYNLVFTYENGIPSDLREVVTDRELVAVPTRYHSDDPNKVIEIMSGPQWLQGEFLIGDSSSRNMLSVAIQAGEVTQYYLADDDILWQRRADWNESGVNASQISQDVFGNAEAGTRRAGGDAFYAAPLRTGVLDRPDEALHHPAGRFPPTLSGSRGGLDGNQFNPPSSIVGNSYGHFGLIGNIVRGHRGFVSASTMRMWNLDTSAELSNVGTDKWPLFRLAPGRARYRITQADRIPEEFAEIVGPWFKTGRATTAWTFTSRPSTAWVPDGYECPSPTGGSPRDRICQVQPLIYLKYNLGLDVHNQAAAGRLHRFAITAGHHSKAIDWAKVTDLTVQASFDDGETWQDADVVSGPSDTFETGGFLPSSAPYQEFGVELDVPPLEDTNGFVALRVQAEDANGGTVDQTIERAYILKEPEEPELVGVDVAPIEASIEVGGKQAFTATARFDDESAQDVTSEVSWASSDESVATITSAGVVTGVAPGEVMVTAELDGVSGQAGLTVTDGDAEASFESLRELVSSFAADGDVTRVGQPRLSVTVSQAERFADRGRVDRAIGRLEKFQDMAADPKLVSSESAREALIDEAGRLIAKLRGDTPDSAGANRPRGGGSAATGEAVVV